MGVEEVVGLFNGWNGGRGLSLEWNAMRWTPRRLWRHTRGIALIF